MPLSQILLLRIFPKEKAGIGLAIWAMTTTTAPILGPMLAGGISDNWSWPWIFRINLPVVAPCTFGAGTQLAPFAPKLVTGGLATRRLLLLVGAVVDVQLMYYTE